MKTHFLEARRVYEAGENVSIALRERLPAEAYSEVIQYAYDLQAGTYTTALTNASLADLKARAGQRIAACLTELGVTSFCDAGTGEATTLQFVLKHLGEGVGVSAFDISLSRLFYAQRELPVGRVDLFCGDIAAVPLVDGAVDAVTTFHALEPNGGRESALVAELLRVSARYLVLVEPDYQRASEAQRSRMERLNYVRTLREALGEHAGRILVDEPWADDSNPDNAASLIVFEKADPVAPTFGYRSPVSGAKIRPAGAAFLGSRNDGFLYPVVRGIPSLLESTAILASHYWGFDEGA